MAKLRLGVMRCRHWRFSHRRGQPIEDDQDLGRACVLCWHTFKCIHLDDQDHRILSCPCFWFEREQLYCSLVPLMNASASKSFANCDNLSRGVLLNLEGVLVKHRLQAASFVHSYLYAVSLGGIDAGFCYDLKGIAWSALR